MNEQTAYMNYVAAVGEKVGHDASVKQARAACPAEYAAWREAFRAQYGDYPA